MIFVGCWKNACKASEGCKGALRGMCHWHEEYLLLQMMNAAKLRKNKNQILI
jgi:hypothetical protein